MFVRSVRTSHACNQQNHKSSLFDDLNKIFFNDTALGEIKITNDS